MEASRQGEREHRHSRVGRYEILGRNVMATESFISLRRFAGLGLILLVLAFCVTAEAQVPAPPFQVADTISPV